MKLFVPVHNFILRGANYFLSPSIFAFPSAVQREVLRRTHDRKVKQRSHRLFMGPSFLDTSYTFCVWHNFLIRNVQSLVVLTKNITLATLIFPNTTQISKPMGTGKFDICLILIVGSLFMFFCVFVVFLFHFVILLFVCLFVCLFFSYLH